MNAAQTEYSARQARIKQLVDALGKELDSHAVKASRQPGNWGFAGDLGRVEATFEELLATLRG